MLPVANMFPSLPHCSFTNRQSQMEEPCYMSPKSRNPREKIERKRNQFKDNIKKYHNCQVIVQCISQPKSENSFLPLQSIFLLQPRNLVFHLHLSLLVNRWIKILGANVSLRFRAKLKAFAVIGFSKLFLQHFFSFVPCTHFLQMAAPSHCQRPPKLLLCFSKLEC